MFSLFYLCFIFISLAALCHKTLHTSTKERMKPRKTVTILNGPNSNSHWIWEIEQFIYKKKILLVAARWCGG